MQSKILIKPLGKKTKVAELTTQEIKQAMEVLREWRDNLRRPDDKLANDLTANNIVEILEKRIISGELGQGDYVEDVLLGVAEGPIDST